MKNLFKTTLSASFLAVVLLSASCKKDEPAPDNNMPTLSVSDIIVGMTDVSSNIAIQAADPDGDALEITWKIIESPASSAPEVVLNGKTIASFTTTIAGLYKVEVTANDGKGKTASGIATLYIGGVLPTSITTNTVYPDLFENEDYPDYYALKSVQVTAGLTLEPGVVIENGADVRIWINGNQAYLNAEGTESKNIILRGIDKVKGSWKTIHIASNNVNNKLADVKILHAGSSEISGKKAALYLQSNTHSSMSIRHTIISLSAGYALYIDGNFGTLTDFYSNAFTKNDAASMRIGADNLFELDGLSNYHGNGIEAIEVASSGNTNAVFSKSGIVRSYNLPYYIYSSLELNAEVSFDPGVTCYFSTNTRLWVTEKGSINANTITKPITFDGISRTPGSWLGIEIDSPSPSNLINGAIIANGGYSGGRGANIYMYGDSPGSQLTITNSTVSGSQTLGIWARSGTAILNQSSNTFSNNALGDVKID